MQQEKINFIELALACQALQWGEFKLKSGRISPYFFNIGMFHENNVLRQLGEYYALLITQNNLNIQHLFGPAYKGIPLATATAIALSQQNKSITVTFNRKEAKDHGEGGILIGASLEKGNTAMIDDVITAGTAFRESKTIIEQHHGRLTTVLITLDRCERGLGEHSTLNEIRELGIEVYSIITFFDLVEYLKIKKQAHLTERLVEYNMQYGSN